MAPVRYIRKVGRKAAGRKMAPACAVSKAAKAAQLQVIAAAKALR
jgi:hypothetical protein